MREAISRKRRPMGIASKGTSETRRGKGKMPLLSLGGEARVGGVADQAASTSTDAVIFDRGKRALCVIGCAEDTE